MEIKIQCGCGSRFAFEVQPVHGRMPTPVACPRCGCEQTEQANRQIASTLAPPPLHGGRRGLKILNLPGYNQPEPEPDQMLVSIPQPGMQTLPVGGKTNHTTELDIPITDNTSAAPHLQDAVTAALAASQIPIIPGGTGAPAAESQGSSGPAAPAPGGLRVRPSKKAQTTTVIHPPLPPVEDVVPVLKRKPETATPAYDDEPPKGVLGWLKASGKAIASTAVVLLVVLKIFGKFKIANLLAIFGIGTASSTSDLNTTNWNFMDYTDATQIYVQVDDPQKVVAACVSYWTSQGKTLTVKASDGELLEDKHYLVTPAHQGYVAVLGGLAWDPKLVDGLAQNLSTSFSTTVMTFAMSDFSGAYRFTIYQSGQKSFSHQLDVAIQGREAVESFKVEGEQWVVERGYFKPDGDGFKNFDVGHINLISQQLGLQWWTFPEDAKGFHDLSE